MLFDAYLMVDWSAASRPSPANMARAKDSIWWALVRGGASELHLENPRTRREAVASIADRLVRLAGEGRRVLLGFDFPFAYPRGTAAALGLSGPPWRAIWDEWSALVEDGEKNENRRFDLAERLNARISGGPFPFWGHDDEGRDRPFLAYRGRRPHGPTDLPERRLGDVGGAKPVWMLHGNGAPGSQALLGIPRLRELRNHPKLRELIRVWPFETGFERGDAQIVLAEVYPSLVSAPPIAGVPLDAWQMRALAMHFAGLDAEGQLAALFKADPCLSDDERTTVRSEEGWIFGVGDRGAVRRPPRRSLPTIRRDYLREPAQIYERSFALVRAEARLDRLPADVARIAERLVHACGMPDIVDELAYSPDVAQAARKALSAGAPIVCDARMVAAGLLPRPNKVQVALAKTAPAGATRSAAGMARAGVAGAVVAIGNAPTALFRLIERIEAGGPRPAAILAFPVGFVGATEAKEALIEARLGVPYLTLRGRRGGSALAAAAVNALLAP